MLSISGKVKWLITPVISDKNGEGRPPVEGIKIEETITKKVAILTGLKMAKDCCWNCKYYIVKGDNEPPVLSSALSNVCVFTHKKDDDRSWTQRACPTPPNYVCRHYRERFY
jgi:hypothetical protein